MLLRAEEVGGRQLLPKGKTKLMSFLPKLQTALGVLFILSTSGAIHVSGQMQTATGSYPNQYDSKSRIDK
jgi:hypothetical protein